MLRKMKLEVLGHVFYESSFDPSNGTLVRVVELPNKYSYWSYIRNYIPETIPFQKRRLIEHAWEAKYEHRNVPFSPVPETIDVSITDWCNFGCSYCYQSSTKNRKHAGKNLIDQIFDSLSDAPYQIAIGGGEPTAHPDFPEILANVRQRGSVPNYTTAGHIRRNEVIEATTELSRSEKGKTAKKNEQKLIDKERAIAELTVDMKKAAELLQFELDCLL